MKPDRKTLNWMPDNCAVREHTADRKSVGRCFFYVGEQKVCPRHGDVSEVQKRYVEDGKLTNDFDLPGKGK